MRYCLLRGHSTRYASVVRVYMLRRALSTCILCVRSHRGMDRCQRRRGGLVCEWRSTMVQHERAVLLDLPVAQQ